MKIAIVGYDIEGQASYRYYAGEGDHDIYIFDEAEELRGAPESATVVTGRGALDRLREMSFDLVVRTPGLPLAKLKGIVNVSSATREFFDRCPAPIIGVTGSKGKGTTASLIAGILEADGRTVHLVGNIGRPALDLLPEITPEDVVVYELSSFQLWDLDQSPRVAVVLMIEPDHLDKHTDLDDYLAAKANIVRHQSADDICIYQPTNPLTAKVVRGGKARKIRYGIEADGGAYIKKNTFFVQDHPICSVDVVRLPGEHNQENACAAITAARVFDASDEAVERGLATFDGLPHRLKYVRSVDGVDYYDDSIATTPGSAIAALNAFDQRAVVILGGSDKGADLSGLVPAVIAKNARSVVLIGAMRDRLKDLFLKAGYNNLQLVEQQATMAQIVEVARGQAQPGDVVIMSPAFASFDMFKSYQDRGEQFVAAVEELR